MRATKDGGDLSPKENTRTNKNRIGWEKGVPWFLSATAITLPTKTMACLIIVGLNQPGKEFCGV